MILGRVMPKPFRFGVPQRIQLNDNTLITNTLSIVGAGLLILITGILFFIFRESVSKYIRFLMPIPPLAVAAYIFVFNMYVYYRGNLPERTVDIVKEIILSVAFSSLVFGAFTVLIILLISVVKKSM